MNRKRLAPIFLLLGAIFLAIGLVTDQDAFSYAAIAFVLIAMFANSKLFKKKR